MDGRDGRMDGWTDGRMDGWTDGTDGTDGTDTQTNGRDGRTELGWTDGTDSQRWVCGERSLPPELLLLFFMVYLREFGHTTIIIAADQREVGNLVRTRAPKSTHAVNFAQMLRFPTLLSEYRPRCKTFH